MAASSAPLEPGLQFPDSRPPPGQMTSPASSILQQYASNNPQIDNRFSRVPITGPFYTQWAELNEIEPVIKIVWNVIEGTDGWQFRAAPLKKRKFNQPVKVEYYPRRALPQVPENVPPPVWMSYEEEFVGTLDRYAAQFELPGDYTNLANVAAQEKVVNYVASIMSGAIISAKFRANAEFEHCKQDHWFKTGLRENSSNMLEITQPFREGYLNLFKRVRGYFAMVADARALSKRDQFEFNLAVLPNGTLDRIAFGHGNYFGEAFRSGPGAIDNLTLGGRKIAKLIDGLEVYEDSKWSLTNPTKRDEEPFLMYTSRGGWIYNRGNRDCGDDEDPNFKYGFGYISKGNKNWAEKTLLELLRESGRFDTNGNLDPHHYTLANQWYTLSRSCGLEPVNGRLDPLLYRIDSELARNEEINTRYLVAEKNGEVDIRYSPLSEHRAHIRKMEYLVKKKLSTAELQQISKLETKSRVMSDVSIPNTSQEAFLAAVCIQNSPDTFIYDAEMFRITNTTMDTFLKMDPFTKAPRIIPKAVDISKLPLATGFTVDHFNKVDRANRAITVTINGKVHVMVGLRLDTTPPDDQSLGVFRGLENDIFGYVAVPLDSRLFSSVEWKKYEDEITGGDPLIAWDKFNGTIAADANDIGKADATVANAAKDSFTSPEVYNNRLSLGTEVTLQWVFRPSADVRKSMANASTKARVAAEREYTNYALVSGKRLGIGQGFKLPFIVEAPDVPTFYGGLNTLRYLGALHQKSEHTGWDPVLLQDCSDGTKSLDTLGRLFMGIYTTQNMYFREDLVPLHLQTADPEMNRLNTALYGLWGEQHKPFLARRPYRYKPASGNWFFPRRFIEGTSTKTPTQWYQMVGQMLVDNFGVAISGADIGTASINYGGASAGQRDQYAKVAAIASLLDSGVMHGNVKNVILDRETFARFKNSYGQSSASTTYANWLKTSAPLVNTNTVATYKTFTTFFTRELQPFLNDAADVMKIYFNRVAASPNDTITEKELNDISRNIYAFGLLLSGLILLWLDNNNMDYNIDGRWLASKKNQALDPNAIVVQTSKGSKDLDQIKNYISANIDARRLQNGMGAPAANSMDWINTGLMVYPKTWKRLETDLNAALDALSTATTSSYELRGEVINIYNTPMRPMMGDDYSKPLAGDSLQDFILVSGLGLATLATRAGHIGHVKEVIKNISQAMTRSKNSELVGERVAIREPSALATGRFAGHVRDAEALARMISGSRFENESGRHVPETFMREPKGPYDSTYIRPIEVRSPNEGTVIGYVEPQHMKVRLEDIDTEYKDDTIGKMAGKLWCFSPINFTVIENMITKGVKPFGTGFVQLRPFQRDLTGAVLFTVTGQQVAETVFNAVLESFAYNQQHNHYNGVLAAYIGAQVLKPQMVYWNYGQTMHGNVNGMKGEMYTDPDSFEPSKVNRTDKDGFIVFVGDGLKIEEIPDCVSITSQYNIDRYGTMVANRDILVSKEQHLPGLIYTMTRFRLNELNQAGWNARGSMYEEKNSKYTNTECFSEDCMYWDGKAFASRYVGNWHLSGFVPEECEFLNGTSLMTGSDKPLSSWKG